MLGIHVRNGSDRSLNIFNIILFIFNNISLFGVQRGDMAYKIGL